MGNSITMVDVLLDTAACVTFDTQWDFLSLWLKSYNVLLNTAVVLPQSWLMLFRKIELWCQ